MDQLMLHLLEVKVKELQKEEPLQKLFILKKEIPKLLISQKITTMLEMQ